MMVNAVRIDARLSNVVLEQDAVSTEELARIDVVSIKKQLLIKYIWNDG